MFKSGTSLTFCWNKVDVLDIYNQISWDLIK